MKIRIKDIAQKAGVSTGTVDRVLHNRGEVKKATCNKVMDVVAEMGYSPNIFAKSLASKRTYHIAVLIPGAQFNNPYWAKPLEGIRKAEAEIKDFNTELIVHLFNPKQIDSFTEACKQVSESEPDAVLLHPFFKEASIQFSQLLDKMATPYVLIDTNLDEGKQLAYFGQDVHQSGCVGARMLHYATPSTAKILLLHLTQGNRVTHQLRKRAEGFLHFFDENSNTGKAVINRSIELGDDTLIQKEINHIYREEPGIQSVFVTNSRVFKVAPSIKKILGSECIVMGYDLIEENTRLLEANTIDFLISQKPIEQGYQGVMALFNQLVLGKKPEAINLSPIDIIIKENLKYYIKTS